MAEELETIVVATDTFEDVTVTSQDTVAATEEQLPRSTTAFIPPMEQVSLTEDGAPTYTPALQVQEADDAAVGEAIASGHEGKHILFGINHKPLALTCLNLQKQKRILQMTRIGKKGNQTIIR